MSGDRPRGARGKGSTAHSLVSQSSPSQPLGQKQRKASTSSMQVPPLRHGWPRQSSMSAGGGREPGPQASGPLPGPRPAPGPQPLTLVAVGACEAAVTDTGKVAPGLADAVSMGATHAGGGHAGHPGPSLEPAAIDHCHRDGRGQPHLCRPRPLTPPHPFRLRPHCSHLCKPRQGTAPGAQSSSCHPCPRGTHSSSRPPGCSSGPRPGRGLAGRSQCAPGEGGIHESPGPTAGAGRRARPLSCPYREPPRSRPHPD